MMQNQHNLAACQWLTPVILATLKAEIGRITVRSFQGQLVLETLSGKNPSQQRAGGVTQGIGPEFKPSPAKQHKKAEFKIIYVSGL
jgi:hypothetical protein